MPTALRQRATETIDAAAEAGDVGEEGGDGDPARDVTERCVAAEQFIATGARHRHFQSEIARGHRAEIAIETIDRWLIHRREDARQLAIEFGARQIAEGMPHAVLLAAETTQLRPVALAPAN